MEPSNLPAYVEQRMRRVIANTGYRVAIEDAEILEFDSEVRYGSPDSPFHHIRISKDFGEHRNHFILSSLAKIERLFAAKDGERYLPLIDAEGRLPRDEEVELARRNPGLSADTLRQVSKQLHAGLVRQLLSFPLDIRVEHELATIPEHAPLQRAYLTRQVGDLEPHFSSTIEVFSPPRAYEASSAMNVAFADACSRLTGERLPRVLRYSSFRRLGQELLELLNSVEDDGHVGDRQTQDRWAFRLGLRNEYTWVRADRI